MPIAWKNWLELAVPDSITGATKRNVARTSRTAINFAMALLLSRKVVNGNPPHEDSDHERRSKDEANRECHRFSHRKRLFFNTLGPLSGRFGARACGIQAAQKHVHFALNSVHSNSWSGTGSGPADAPRRELGLEGIAVEAEEPGGFKLVPPNLLEDSKDDLPLELLARFLQ